MNTSYIAAEMPSFNDGGYFLETDLEANLDHSVMQGFTRNRTSAVLPWYERLSWVWNVVPLAFHVSDPSQSQVPYFSSASHPWNLVSPQDFLPSKSASGMSTSTLTSSVIYPPAYAESSLSSSYTPQADSRSMSVQAEQPQLNMPDHLVSKVLNTSRGYLLFILILKDLHPNKDSAIKFAATALTMAAQAHLYTKAGLVPGACKPPSQSFHSADFAEGYHINKIHLTKDSVMSQRRKYMRNLIKGLMEPGISGRIAKNDGSKPFSYLAFVDKKPPTPDIILTRVLMLLRNEEFLGLGSPGLLSLMVKLFSPRKGRPRETMKNCSHPYNAFIGDMLQPNTVVSVAVFARYILMRRSNDGN
ncbi:hypothetical protein SERLA73DRAFT_73749 [Serpula lacrymans var. lacrymans S7.3]|uniref:Uncharacterized protein n=2 Tax=Serpula lacrymans var. lacrymans TaxID=341189 RepID=F8PZ93_SERL3|nr:uncharacterized protein SERLADRAFT_438377 [Serpula lacrymans var. lacrymans S7.9]EGN99206.1 hypothetical protein SERLA73DRAFT_73749 [Serpula lacrymans var. lacrymans S7.3]EGO24772.1 hypothetical protein SERLADRAFT_438377 [Serpula lacrymans var. lacrymans S7.9]